MAWIFKPGLFIFLGLAGIMGNPGKLFYRESEYAK